MSNYKEARPWGEFECLLEETYCKVKKIIVKPNQAPSYQYHFKRNEAWVIVQGQGKLLLDNKKTLLKVGQSIQIPVMSKHQIINTGESDLIFIEVQTGKSFEEEDIVAYYKE